MLPDFVILENGTKVPIKQFCLNHCRQRFNSECWNDCDLEREFMDEDY